MRAFVYCRVSTKEQGSDDHYSLDNQQQRCSDYIKGRQWRVQKVRKDIASGKNDEREGFQELRQLVTDKKIDVVVVYRLDRLSRNVRDIYDFLDLLKDTGIAFVSITEGFDTTTAMGRAMLGVAAVFAQLTREMIAENVRDGMQRRAEAGLFNGNARKIYGYTYSRELGLVPVEEEAAVVRQIFEWYAHHKWGSLKIARMLNLRNVPSKMGVGWSGPGIMFLIRNRTYRGEVKIKDGWINGKHDEIVPIELFDAAQVISDTRRVLAPRTQDSPHLLSGIAMCGDCSSRLYVHSIAKGPNNRKHISYFHKASVKTKSSTCPGFYKSASALEQAVVTEIARLSESGAIRKVVLKDVQQRQNSERVPMIGERDKLLLEMEKLGERFTQWADRLDGGAIDEEQFERQNRRLLEQKKRIQERLEVLEAELAGSDELEVSMEEVRKALDDFPSLWQELELEERRELLRLLIEDLKVFKTQLHLKLLFLDPVTVPLKSNPGRPVGRSKRTESTSLGDAPTVDDSGRDQESLLG